PNINENLEQQAQALFKAWFVDFEPFGGVMPDDWRMGTLSEICGYSKDKIDIDNLTLDSYYSTENMQPNRQGAVQATTLPTIKQTTACKKGDVLISNIRPYFKKILYCFSDCGCSTDVLCFVPNKTDYSAFLYCALYADKFFDYMVAGSKGTKMPRGDKQQIMVYPICIPSAEYIEKFNQAVASMLETVYTNRIEENNLANLRDTLLPKLMNGEIDVSAVKI
ncbi:restriction endonuclease subunit S, partial [Ruminococcus bicirculans (ex Wegman et al. 2014)]|uniref:restriction endonuclease subunit S n=1 Tax=Ruminococcus bicirculans (ex Wegman et al. 2014) TaxID=1160721 RepID=UPI0022E0E002